MDRPLANIRVIDFTHVVAGPHCCMWLASLGAEVIKVESLSHPDSMRISQLRAGDEGSVEHSPTFVAANLMKKSCAIDISKPEGQDLAKRLVALSDVAVENFSPGVMDRFGLGYKDLVKVKPDLVMASISGFGQEGAYAGFVGVGQTIQAFSGLSSSTGYLGGPPEQFFMYYSDVLSGQSAAFGVLAALRHRMLTGEGQYVDVAMSEAAISVAPGAALHYAMTGRNLDRRENRDELMSPHGCYRCLGHERWIAVAVQNEAEWREFVRVLGHTQWLTDPRFLDMHLRLENQDDLDALINGVTRELDAYELSTRLQAAGIAAAPTQTAKDILADPHLDSRDFFVEVDQGALGTAKLPRMPWRISGVEHPVYTPAPRHGDSTDEVLQGLVGLDVDEIERLRSIGAVGH
jgi:benzylsuccinate CoA-transferase BbsF subunit